MKNRINVLGVEIDAISDTKVIEKVDKLIEDSDSGSSCCDHWA